ncbi:MAG: CHASE2 domain-containing protein [Coleofasciculus sp. G1-WW12-02]|uniref:CHASE2 domain-containing protein n=1 Tax=Coleofasciculus sp. G1-WW12-02 TaxID=3068483 RepID=UPI003301E911
MRSYSTLPGSLIISFAIALFLLLIRSLGGLQPWELSAYDQMMRSRPPEGRDSRLLVIEVTATDLQLPEQDDRKGSLADGAIAKLLQKLESYQPRGIGLLIFRDFPVDPQFKKLRDRFESDNRFFAICHAQELGNQDSGESIPRPPELPKERQGFDNILPDPDGIVRRHLLSMEVSTTSRCSAEVSISLLLALRYLELEEKNISPLDFNSEGNLQLGQVIFERLKASMGAYQRVDTGGTQIIINYRSPTRIAETVSVADVLAGQLNPEVVQDKIILIGARHVNSKSFTTPNGEKISGVMLQAQMISQILSAVLNNRPMIWFFPAWVEIIWILAWALIGASLNWKIRHPLFLGLSAIPLLGILFGIGFFILSSFAGWIPVVPAALVLIGMQMVGVFLRLPEFITVSRVADVLQRCQTPGDIAAIANQLAWIPSPPPRVFGFIVPQFLEVSQSVQSVREATSSYRQYEFLGRSISRLHSLQESLAFNKDAQQVTRLEKIAQQWLKILQTAQQTLAEQAKRSAEIPQVYIAGASLNPDDAKTRFKGRLDIFREVETLALSAQPPILLLHGGRRTGKTSTLKYLPRKVGSELIPLLIDLQGAATATTLKGLANYLAEEIVKAAKKSRNFDLPYPNPQQLNQEPFLTLQTWLEKLERIAPGKRFLLCLDEFERLSEVIATTNSRVPLNFLRHVLQHRRQWILLFSGSHTLDELEPYWSDYLINTRSLRVSYLQKPEAEELIVKPIADFPKIYEPLTVSQIIQATRCQPYLVQLLCTVIVDHLNREKRRLATPDDVQTCIPIAIETGGMYFRELWTSLSDAEQEVLEYLITEQTPHPSLKSTIRRLIRKEILEKVGDCYRFQVPLVETFITQVVTV